MDSIKQVVIVVAILMALSIPLILCHAEEEACCEDCSIPVEPLGEFEVTYYTSNGSLTYSETTPELGVCAVDPSIIPLGSTICIVYADGSMRECRCEDTGGAIKGRILDVWLPSEDMCVAEGRDTAMVYIVKE